MAWQVGEQVGSYEITGLIGTGGMATVYRAYHKRLDREVAIKVIHESFLSDQDFLARFEREARIVARLDHPNIVPVYDFAEHEGRPYLVMKQIQGQTLKDMYAERPPTLDEIVKITSAVAAALTYAHQQDILHRDVKPGNVIIDDEGNVYLTDFGLARLAQTGESSMSAGMVVGTPNYLSPEQASGESDVSEQSDVYSLGVMIYEMIVGRVPFLGTTPFATVHKHIYEDPPIPSKLNPEVPVQVEQVLLRALEKDPAKRYESPDALAVALNNAVRDSGLSELSENRSGVFQRAAPAPTPRMVEQGVPAPVDAPAPRKSKHVPYNSELLLLNGEESWANLPKDEIIRRRQAKRRGELIGFISHALPYIGVNLMIILGAAADNSLDAGAFVTAFAWGAGLAAHAIQTYFQTRRPIENLYLQFDEQMADRYGQNWRQTAPDVNILRDWQLSLEQYEERKGFFTHLGVFVMINLMFWMLYGENLFQSGDLFPWPLIITMGWGIGVVAHGMRAQRAHNDPKTREEIASELALMEGLGSGKAKRSQDAAKTLRDQEPIEVRLTDDGEFTESMMMDMEENRGRYSDRS